MATATTIASTKCRPFVQQLKPFTNYNKTLFGYWVKPDIYAVFSYGNHWPLFIWEDDGFGSGAWYANSDKYSPTTSKHYTQAHPHSDPAPLPLKQKDMLTLLEYGIAGVAAGIPNTYDSDYEQYRQNRELYTV